MVTPYEHIPVLYCLPPGWDKGAADKIYCFCFSSIYLSTFPLITVPWFSWGPPFPPWFLSTQFASTFGLPDVRGHRQPMISNSWKKIFISPKCNIALLLPSLAFLWLIQVCSVYPHSFLFCLFSYQLQLLFQFWLSVDPGSLERGMKSYENCTVPRAHPCWRTPECDGLSPTAPVNCPGS